MADSKTTIVNSSESTGQGGGKGPVEGTVFDSVYKTLIHKAPQLIVPLINEAFGKNYPGSALVLQFSNEHEGPRGNRVSDSIFQLQDKLYHVECQSTPDNSMVVRMIEYDFAIALESAINAGEPYEMDFPESCVLFLRHTSNTPDMLQMKVNIASGESFMYESRVMKAQLYDSNEIFEKRLLVLLPFYLMRYEKVLGAIEDDDVRTAQLIAECAGLRAELERATLAAGDAVLYEQLVELIIRVSDHMMEKHEMLRKKVRSAMGGEVLELMRDRAERLEREAEARGIELGIEQGIEQGIAQGIAQGRSQAIEELVALLRERGVDEAIISEFAASQSEG